MEVDQHAGRSLRQTLAPAAVLIAAGLGAYHNCFTAPFYLDDLHAIVENRQLQSFWPATSLGARRQVGHVTFALNYRLGGTEVWGYRAGNVAIHLLAGLVLFGLVRRTLQLPNVAPRYAQGATSLALAAALLWVVHPLQTASVTYVVQRLESLMGLFYLTCLYCMARGAQTERPWPWYVGAIGACWLGMATKEVMITAPLVVLLYDRVFLAASWQEVILRRGWVYLAFVPAVAWLVLRTRDAFAPLLQFQDSELLDPSPTKKGPSAGFGLEEITPWEYLRSQPGVILHYLRLAFWPDRLCLDYFWPLARGSWSVYAPGAAIVSLLAGSLAALRWRPRVGFVGVSFFLILAPTSSIMPIRDLAFEHRMYLPLASVAVLSVLALHHLLTVAAPDPAARRLVAGAALAAATLALGLRTVARNAEYHDPVTIWSQSLAVAPENWRAHQHLGVAWEERGEIARAIHHYRESLRLKPESDRMHHNLARLLAQQGRIEAALAHYRQALELNPQNARSHQNLGLLLAEQGEFEEGKAHLQKAAALDPQNARIQVNLGDLYVRQHDLEAAAEHFRRAIEFRPDFLAVRLKLATCYYRTGRVREAVGVLRDAVDRNPGLYEGALLLGWILSTHEDAQLRDGAEAVRRLEPIRKLTLNADPVVLDVLAAAYAEAGRFDQAIATARRAVRLARTKENQLRRAMEDRLRRYEAGEPYRESPGRREDLGFLSGE